MGYRAKSEKPRYQVMVGAVHVLARQQRGNVPVT